MSASANTGNYGSSPYNNNFEGHGNSSMDGADAQTLAQERIKSRDTKSRLESARRVEKAVAELGTMFGKMATLVQQQSETIGRIEDDTEVSLLDVQSGNAEIQKVKEITQGNRALIIKIFVILIGLIVFFKLY